MAKWSFVGESSTSSLLVPQHLAWDFYVHNGDVIGSIKSRKKRRTARRMNDLIKQHNLNVEISPLTEQSDFLKLRQFFINSHKNKNHELTIQLSDGWLESKKAQQRTVEKIEIWQNDQLVGMKMYSYDASDFFLSYKASEPSIDQECELGLLLDVISFQRAIDLGFSVIKVGKGKNLFGLTLQLSLFSYKCSLGMHMYIRDDDKPQKICFEQGVIDSPFVLLAYLKECPKLLFVHPDNEQPTKLEQFTPVNVTITPISYSDLIALQERH